MERELLGVVETFSNLWSLLYGDFPRTELIRSGFVDDQKYRLYLFSLLYGKKIDKKDVYEIDNQIDTSKKEQLLSCVIDRLRSDADILVCNLPTKCIAYKKHNGVFIKVDSGMKQEFQLVNKKTILEDVLKVEFNLNAQSVSLILILDS